MKPTSYFRDRFTKNKTEIYFLFIFSIILYLLNTHIVYAFDDYFYKTICEDPFLLQPTENRDQINNIQDIFLSQCNHYKYINGRFLLHFLVQLFTSILPIQVFHICNTIAMIILLKYICLMSIAKEYQRNLIYYITTFLIFWIFMGFLELGFTYLSNVAYSINYLWPSTFFILILYLHKKYANNNVSTIKKISFFILALCCGASHEAFSIGLSAAFFLYYSFHIKQFKGIVKIISIGLWLGTLTLIISPANFTRYSGISNQNNLTAQLYQLYDYAIELIPIFFCTFYFIASKKHKIQNNLFYILIFIFSFLFLAFVNFSGSARIFTSLMLICTVFISKEFNNHLLPKIKNKTPLYILSIFISIHLLSIFTYRSTQKNYLENIIAQYISNNDGYITINEKAGEANFLLQPFGINITEIPHRITHTLDGINQLYFNNNKAKATFVPNLKTLPNNIVINNDNYSLYNYGWCFVIESKEQKKYIITSNDFSHKDLLLKIYAKISKKAPTIIVDSYIINIQGHQLQIIPKQNKAISINSINIL